MEVEVSASKDALKIALAGELSANQATGFAERLIQLCNDKLRNTITLDLAACDKIDTLGFGALVGFRLSPTIFEKKVVLINVNPAIREQMKILKFENLFVLDGEGKVSG